MLLTLKQIKQIKKIINKHFNTFILSALGAKYLSDEDRKELEKLGAFDEGVNNENIFHDAFKIGRTRSLSNDVLPKMDYKKWKEYILGMYLDDKDKKVLENVDSSTSHYLDSLKDKVVNRVMTAIIDANKEATLSNIGSPIGPSYERADREAVDIKKLADDLQESTKDINRDWQKVVVTELNSAHSQGSIQSILEDNKGKDPDDILVYCVGPLDAATCQYCKKHYHDGGSFKIYRLSELLANGTNIGLKAGTWKAVVPPMHPNCRHRLVELPQGYTLDEDGKIEFVGLKHHELNSPLKKSSVQRGGTKAQHKYIKRTGGPGSYKYWYQDEHGKLYEGKNAPEGHADFDTSKKAPLKQLTIKQRVDHLNVDTHQKFNRDWESNLNKNPRILVHYSDKSDLKTIDPSKMGSGVDASVKGREMGTGAKFSFYYRPDGPVENHVLNSSHHKHIVSLPEHTKLYDISKDNENLRQNAKNNEDYFRAIKNAGYEGFYNSSHDYDAMKNAVTMFNPLDVIHSNNITPEDRAKAEGTKEYKAQMQKMPSNFNEKSLNDYLTNGKFSLITPQNPKAQQISPAENQKRYEEIKNELTKRGAKFTEVEGNYNNNKEDSLMVEHSNNVTPQLIDELGKKYQQESVIHSDKSSNTMPFIVHDTNQGQAHKGEGFETGNFDKDYSKIKGTNLKFRLNFDWDRLHPYQNVEKKTSAVETKFDHNKIESDVKNVINTLSNKLKANAQIRKMDGDIKKDNEMTIRFNSDKDGGFWTPRPEEPFDDDHPNFTARDQIHEELVKKFGDKYDISENKSEKGMFSITIKKKNEPIKKGGLQRGGAKSGHKYLKRTGGPGNYRYWYKDEKGRIYEGKNAPEEHKDFDSKKAKHLYSPHKGAYLAAKDFPIKTIKVKKKGAPKKIIVKQPKNVIAKINNPFANEIHHDKKHNNFLLKKDGNNIGGLNIGEDPDTGVAQVDWINPGVQKWEDPEGKHTKELYRHLLKSAMSKHDELISRDATRMDGKEIAAWLDLGKNEFKGKITQLEGGRFLYMKEGIRDEEGNLVEDALSSEGAPLDYNYNIKDYNKHLAPAAESVFNDFRNRTDNFTQITEGVCGLKGFVNYEGKEYFVKSEKGGFVPPELLGEVPLTQNETTYTDIVHEAIPELKEFFPPKLKLSKDTFMQEKVNLAKFADSDQELSFYDDYANNNIDKITKLALTNYLLGNKDRHGGNVGIDKNTGDIKLFDEGLTIEPAQQFERLPRYLGSMGSLSLKNADIYKDMSVNTDDLKQFFNYDRQQNILNIMNNNHATEKAKAGFIERWNAMHSNIEWAEKNNKNLPDFMLKTITPDNFASREGMPSSFPGENSTQQNLPEMKITELAPETAKTATMTQESSQKRPSEPPSFDTQTAKERMKTKG